MNQQFSVARAEPGKLRSALFAFLVHVLFLVVLVFSLDWKSETPEAMTVDLWADLPNQAPPPTAPKQTQVEAQAPKADSAKPEKSQIAVAVPPPVRKPDIVLKDKVKKPEPKVESPQISEPVKKEVVQEKPATKVVEQPSAPKEVKKVKPVKKQEPEVEPVKKTEQEKERKVTDQSTETQKSSPKRTNEAVISQAAHTAASGEVEKYKALIQAKIRSRIVMPPDLPGNPAAEFRVTLLPGGDVLLVTLRKSSGYTVFDEAVERAVYLAKPLPLPSDAGLFNLFRNLDLTVYYQE